MDTKDTILHYIRDNGDVSIKELSEHTGLSRQSVHRHINQLIDLGLIIKIGRAPIVYYQLNDYTEIPDTKYDASDREFLEANFAQIREDGTLLTGENAFNYWCHKRKLPPIKTFEEFKKTFQKYAQFKQPQGWIEGTQKLLNTNGIGQIYIDRLFYIDFYAIERFGKTMLGQLLHFAKQGQNKDLAKKLIAISRTVIFKLIEYLQIDAIAFVPPTISRNFQIMDMFKSQLNPGLPLIILEKVRGEIVVPQKALSKIEERVMNARKSIVSPTKQSYKNVLIIDDAVGSGATINESAGKILKKGNFEKIYGLAITGSYKGFEVISEA